MEKITFCISTYNNYDYLKLAVHSVRKNSYFKNAPFVVHAENCDDGTNEWLEENKDKYDLIYSRFTFHSITNEQHISFLDTIKTNSYLVIETRSKKSEKFY